MDRGNPKDMYSNIKVFVNGAWLGNTTEPIELYNAFVEKKQLIMIMEYAGGGELLGYLQKRGTLNEIDAR